LTHPKQEPEVNEHFNLLRAGSGPSNKKSRFIFS
jgi:hypothetical protein